MRDTNIWRIGLDPPAQASRVLASTMDDDAAAYSPDGRWIALASIRWGAEEIWIANADGSHPCN